MQGELREKVKHMKALSAELHVVQAKVNEDKYEIERLRRELQESKRRFFAAKRRERDEIEKRAAADAAQRAPIPLLPPPADQTRFMGGGFAVTAPAA